MNHLCVEEKFLTGNFLEKFSIRVPVSTANQLEVCSRETGLEAAPRCQSLFNYWLVPELMLHKHVGELLLKALCISL